MEWVALKAEITAYSPNSTISQTTDTTFNGTDTDEVPYALAADRRIKLGTIIYIPTGRGVLDQARAFSRGFQVDDRGGALEHHNGGPIRLDLRVKDEKWAKRFGRKIITVWVRK